MTSGGPSGSGRVVVTADEAERNVLARMDLDRYEAQVIPDLHERLRELTRALEEVVAASEAGSESNRTAAVARARSVLADSRVASKAPARRYADRSGVPASAPMEPPDPRKRL